MWVVVFFFQAEDGIRDDLVTGVQTCALPIWTTKLGMLIREVKGVNPPEVSKDLETKNFLSPCCMACFFSPWWPALINSL